MQCNRQCDKRPRRKVEGDGMLYWNSMIQSTNASAHRIVASRGKIIAATARLQIVLHKDYRICEGLFISAGEAMFNLESQELSFCMSQLIGDTRRTGGMVGQSGTTHLVSVTYWGCQQP